MRLNSSSAKRSSSFAWQLTAVNIQRDVRQYGEIKMCITQRGIVYDISALTTYLPTDRRIVFDTDES